MNHLGSAHLRNEGLVVAYDDPSELYGRFPINHSMIEKGVEAVLRHECISKERAERVAIECWIAMSLENSKREK